MPNFQQEYLPYYNRDKKYRYTISAEKLMTGNVEDLKKFQKQTPARTVQEYFDGRIAANQYIQELSGHRESNKKQKTRVQSSEDGSRIVLEGPFEAGNQTSNNGCWSVSLELMLQSRGVNIPQEYIRAFRPFTGTSQTMPKYTQTDLKAFNDDDGQDLYTRAELITKTLPNTGLHQRQYSTLSDELEYDHLYLPQFAGDDTVIGREIAREGNRPKPVDEEKLGAQIMKDVSEALRQKQSPVSMMFGGHFRTVVGVDVSKRELLFLDSMSQKENDIKTCGVQDVIDDTRGKGDGRIVFYWLEDLEPNKTGELNVAEGVSYQNGRLVETEEQEITTGGKGYKKFRRNDVYLDSSNTSCLCNSDDSISGVSVSDYLFLPKQITTELQPYEETPAPKNFERNKPRHWNAEPVIGKVERTRPLTMPEPQPVPQMQPPNRPNSEKKPEAETRKQEEQEGSSIIPEASTEQNHNEPRQTSEEPESSRQGPLNAEQMKMRQAMIKAMERQRQNRQKAPAEQIPLQEKEKKTLPRNPEIRQPEPEAGKPKELESIPGLPEEGEAEVPQENVQVPEIRQPEPEAGKPKELESIPELPEEEGAEVPQKNVQVPEIRQQTPNQYDELEALLGDEPEGEGIAKLIWQAARDRIDRMRAKEQPADHRQEPSRQEENVQTQPAEITQPAEEPRPAEPQQQDRFTELEQILGARPTEPGILQQVWDASRKRIEDMRVKEQQALDRKKQAVNVFGVAPPEKKQEINEREHPREATKAALREVIDIYKPKPKIGDDMTRFKPDSLLTPEEKREVERNKTREDRVADALRYLYDRIDTQGNNISAKTLHTGKTDTQLATLYLFANQDKPLGDYVKSYAGTKLTCGEYLDKMGTMANADQALKIVAAKVEWLKDMELADIRTMAKGQDLEKYFTESGKEINRRAGDALSVQKEEIGKKGKDLTPCDRIAIQQLDVLRGRFDGRSDDVSREKLHTPEANRAMATLYLYANQKKKVSEFIPDFEDKEMTCKDFLEQKETYTREGVSKRLATKLLEANPKKKVSEFYPECTDREMTCRDFLANRDALSDVRMENGLAAKFLLNNQKKKLSEFIPDIPDKNVTCLEYLQKKPILFDADRQLDRLAGQETLLSDLEVKDFTELGKTPQNGSGERNALADFFTEKKKDRELLDKTPKDEKGAFLYANRNKKLADVLPEFADRELTCRDYLERKDIFAYNADKQLATRLLKDNPKKRISEYLPDFADKKMTCGDFLAKMDTLSDNRKNRVLGGQLLNANGGKKLAEFVPDFPDKEMTCETYLKTDPVFLRAAKKLDALAKQGRLLDDPEAKALYSAWKEKERQELAGAAAEEQKQAAQTENAPEKKTEEPTKSPETEEPTKSPETEEPTKSPETEKTEEQPQKTEEKPEEKKESEPKEREKTQEELDEEEEERIRQKDDATARPSPLDYLQDIFLYIFTGKRNANVEKWEQYVAQQNLEQSAREDARKRRQKRESKRQLAETEQKELEAKEKPGPDLESHQTGVTKEKAAETSDNLTDVQKKEMEAGKSLGQIEQEKNKNQPDIEKNREKEQKEKQKTSGKDELEQIFEKLKEAYGKDDLPETVKKNVQKLHDDAVESEKTMQSMISMAGPKGQVNVGDNLPKVVAYESLKNTLLNGGANLDMLKNQLEKNSNFVGEYQASTLTDQTKHLATGPHAADFVQGFLTAEGKKMLADTFSEHVEKTIKPKEQAPEKEESLQKTKTLQKEKTKKEPSLQEIINAGTKKTEKQPAVRPKTRTEQPTVSAEQKKDEVALV